VRAESEPNLVGALQPDAHPVEAVRVASPHGDRPVHGDEPSPRARLDSPRHRSQPGRQLLLGDPEHDREDLLLGRLALGQREVREVQSTLKLRLGWRLTQVLVRQESAHALAADRALAGELAGRQRKHPPVEVLRGPDELQREQVADLRADRCALTRRPPIP
jgi:hypothetical protein